MKHSFTPVDLLHYGFFAAVDIAMIGVVVLGLLFVFYAVVSPPTIGDPSGTTEAEE